nr:uncharacterized protein LOC109158743 [Ipomoea batatas]
MHVMHRRYYSLDEELEEEAQDEEPLFERPDGPTGAILLGKAKRAQVQVSEAQIVNDKSGQQNKTNNSKGSTNNRDKGRSTVERSRDPQSNCGCRDFANTCHRHRVLCRNSSIGEEHRRHLPPCPPLQPCRGERWELRSLLPLVASFDHAVVVKDRGREHGLVTEESAPPAPVVRVLRELLLLRKKGPLLPPATSHRRKNRARVESLLPLVDRKGVHRHVVRCLAPPQLASMTSPPQRVAVDEAETRCHGAPTVAVVVTLPTHAIATACSAVSRRSGRSTGATFRHVHRCNLAEEKDGSCARCCRWWRASITQLS